MRPTARPLARSAPRSRAAALAGALLLLAACSSHHPAAAPGSPVVGGRPAGTPGGAPTAAATAARASTTTTTTAPLLPAADGLSIGRSTAGAWIVAFDAHKLHLRLMPGRREPEGAFVHPSNLTPDLARTVVAAFNGGFQLHDAQGGLYLDGIEGAKLVAGSASLVIRKDGTATVGSWGRDVTMGPDVQAVLQNLQLMVDHGAPTDVSDTDKHRWGSTISHELRPDVARSGICVTGGGELRWVGAHQIGAASLAAAMIQAGCVRGMELDINPMFVSFAVFDHPDPRNPAAIVGHNLFEGMHYQPSDYVKGRDRNWLMVSTS